MAISARIPNARAVSVAGVNGEVGVRVEGRRLPGQCSMAHGALSVEPRSYMIGVLGRYIDIFMAGDAFARRPTISTAYVTADARYGLVRPASRELSPVVVEARDP